MQIPDVFGKAGPRPSLTLKSQPRFTEISGAPPQLRGSINICERTHELWRLPAEVMRRVTWFGAARGVYCGRARAKMEILA